MDPSSFQDFLSSRLCSNEENVNFFTQFNANLFVFVSYWQKRENKQILHDLNMIRMAFMCFVESVFPKKDTQTSLCAVLVYKAFDEVTPDFVKRKMIIPIAKVTAHHRNEMKRVKAAFLENWTYFSRSYVMKDLQKACPILYDKIKDMTICKID